MVDMIIAENFHCLHKRLLVAYALCNELGLRLGSKGSNV